MDLKRGLADKGGSFSHKLFSSKNDNKVIKTRQHDFRWKTIGQFQSLSYSSDSTKPAVNVDRGVTPVVKANSVADLPTTLVYALSK